MAAFMAKFTVLSCNAMLCSVVKFSALYVVQFSVVQCSVVQCSEVQCSVVHFRAMRRPVKQSCQSSRVGHSYMSTANMMARRTALLCTALRGSA